MAPEVSVSIKILIRSQSSELDRDCCPFVIKVAWEPETQSSLPVTGRHRAVFLMRQDYPQIIINYYLASSKNINNQQIIKLSLVF